MADTRIYVACLASYNNGVLHGAWIDCEGKTDSDIQTEVNAILRDSRFPNVTVDCPECCELDAQDCKPDCETCKGSGKVPSAEEWAIHDTEGFGRLIGEYTSFSKVAEHAAMIAEHGDAWIAYCGHVGEDYAEESGFSDAYSGTWDSELAFAEDLVDSLGYLEQMPESLRYYFDYDKFARDLFINDYWRDDETGAVFNRNC